jgi:membrane-associated protease RseP (regulator of RpoE activity)
MPDGIVPPGYRAQLLGSVTSIDALNLLAPLEEGVAEGSLMLMQLNFEELPSSEKLSELAQRLSEEGVPTWPGYSHIVAIDQSQASVYLGWIKGIAWMTVIIGILVLLVLPALLGGLIWWLLPESVKNLIEMMVMVGIMFLMMKFMTPMLKSGEKEKK